MSCLRLVNTVRIFIKFLRTQPHRLKIRGSVITKLLLYYVFIGCPQNYRGYKGVRVRIPCSLSQDFPCSLTIKFLLLTRLWVAKATCKQHFQIFFK